MKITTKLYKSHTEKGGWGKTMRILEFEVKKQRLRKLPGCDFSGIVAGSIGYLRAKFHLSPEEWQDCTVKVARFWLGDKESSVKLDKNNTCDIPPEVLTGERFAVSVLGKSKDYKIETNKFVVKQEVIGNGNS